MSKFNIGDKVMAKNSSFFGEEVGILVGIDTREGVYGKYLVKFNSLGMSEGFEYNMFRNRPDFIIKPYDGYATWLNNLIKVEDECKGEICMSKFNIGDKVVSKGYPNLGEEVGIIVGIDLRKESNSGKYLVKFNSLDMGSGWVYGVFRNDLNLIIEPYEGYAEWVNEDDLVKVEDKCKENEYEEECEEDIRTKFESVRKQKEEIIKEKSKKVLELTLEIKEIEHEIEKIKKEWHLD